MTGEAGDHSDSIRSKVLRGVAWKAASQIVLQGSRLVTLVLLARLLTPSDYGLAGMTLVFASFVFVFSDLALGAALVQRRTLDEADRSTVFWVSVGAGLVFTVGGIAGAGAVADFYGEPDVKPLFMFLSISYVLTSLGSTQTALLTRTMQFRQLELRQIAATLVAAAVAITVAVAGGGAWAIVAQQVTVAGVATALVWRFSDWRPHPILSLKSLRELGGFSASVFGQRLLYYAGRNVDNLLVGRYLGPAALGTYAVSYNLMLVPFSQIAGPIQQVLFPAFAQMQDDRPRMAQVWLRVTRLVGAVVVPALLGLIVVAPDFVDVILGERWHEAVPVIRILAWVGLLQSLQTLNGDILLALGKAGLFFRFTIGWFLVNLVAFVIGLQWGVVGVAAAYAVSSTVLEPLNAYLTARALRISFRSVLRNVLGIFQAGCIMAAVVLGGRSVLQALEVPAALRLAIVVALGAAVYVAALTWRARDVVDDLRTLRARRGAPPS